ncbi:prepilin peptidase [Paenibacillus mesotrionivorans]|uniref:Prepilin peptidase n=1 Tax=Paenibacillus mesotrionivorans TaxID=3160968 RepID=A0ACC7NST8_9BACL
MLIIQAFEASPPYFYTVMGILGLFVGSFLNVVAARIPQGQSLVTPPSHCDSCGHRLAVPDLIPVWSWFRSGGKCRYCGEAFSIQYPLWEVLTSVIYILLAVTLGPVPELIVGLLLVSLLIAISQTDLRLYLIPDKIIVFGIAAGIVLRIFIHDAPWWDYVGGFFLGGGLLYLAAVLGEWLLKKEAMGGGDIKLLAMLGIYIGMKGVLLTIFLGSVIGLIIILILLLTGVMKNDQPIPFGPFLAIGACVAYLWGELLVQAYLNLLT